MVDDALSEWNALAPHAAADAILPCCGSWAWACTMAERRPLRSAGELIKTAGEVWWKLPEAAWHEAFGSHPRIGESQATGHATVQSSAWSAEEQRSASTPDAVEQLAEANRFYEQRFGRIFLICATGKSASEVLAALQDRLGNDPVAELQIAAEEQRRITELRLQRWLAGGEGKWASRHTS